MSAAASESYLTNKGLTPKPQTLTWKGFFLGLLPVAVIVVVSVVVLESYGVAHLRDFITESGPLAPLAYILVKILTFVFAPLSSGPLQLTSGLMFGFWGGALYSLIGEVLGGAINFWIARRLGRPVVRRFVGQNGLDQMDRFSDNLGGWGPLFYARIFLFSVYDLISYAVGLTHSVSFGRYLVVSVVGGVIPALGASAVGVSLMENPTWLFVIYGLIGLVSVIPLMLRFLRRKNAPD
jgi:uncharacterized membrane protein YdjX (TVP38/TMEM64 family)